MFATLSSPSPPHIFNLTAPPQLQQGARPCAFSTPQAVSSKQDAPSTPRSSLQQSSPSYYSQRYASQVRAPANRVAGRNSRDIRRAAFFNRIRQDRDSSRFNAREDRMVWMEYITQKQRFENEMMRSAPEVENVDDDQMEMSEDDRPSLDSRNEEQDGIQDDEAALEEYLTQEREYDEFLEEMEQEFENNHMQRTQNDEEDDYERIFADIASHCESGLSNSGEEMDMSCG